jgi:hypothetical protein
MVATINPGAIAGTKLYIGTSEAIPSPDDFIEVKNISNLGSFGGTNFNKIALESVGDGYTRQLKGTQLAPPMDVVLNRDDDDPGQVLMKAASADRNSLFWFKVEENDGPPTNITPTYTRFQGRVYGWVTTGGGVNDLKRINTSIEIEPDTITTVGAT